MIDNLSQLVQAAQHGDTRAVEQLYAQTFKTAYLTTKSIVQNQNDAPSIVKESYLQAFYNINTIPNAGEFDKWFNGIVDRKAKEYLSAKKPQLFLQNNSAQASFWVDDKNTITAGIAPNIANSAMNTIYSLPENQNLIVIMYYSQNMSTQEIADTLSLSADEVKGTLFNAKQRVEQELAGFGVGQMISTASVIFAALNSAAQTCTPPAGEIQNIIGTLTGSAPAAPNPNINTQAPNVNTQVPNINTQAPSSANLNGVAPAAEPKKGISKGAKLAIIIGAAAVVVAIIAIVLIVIFSQDSSEENTPPEPVTIVETTPTEATEATEATENNNSSSTTGTPSIDTIFDESYALPSGYKVSGASYDSKTGYDSGFGLDEKTTIETIEKLPEIKSIVDDKDSYIRYEVTQSNSTSREIYNYYGGDDASYSIFIDTTESGCTNPNRIALIFNSHNDDLGGIRATAREILKTTKLDEDIINALLYTDRDDSDAVESANGLGNYYFTNDIDDDSIGIFISYYPSYSKGSADSIKAKYYEEDTSKYFDLNTVFNNPDVDFNNDLTKEGLTKYTSVSAAKTINSENYRSSFSYTTDQDGKIVEVEYSIYDSVIFKTADGAIQSAYIDFEYSQEDGYDSEASISVEFDFADDCKTRLADASKLAYEQFKFFDKDFPLSESDLLLKKNGASLETDFKSNFSNKKNATLSIEDDGTISYEIEWELDN